ncbi:MAG: hypothetical protein V1664_03100 [Candidatus Uhrbacteria bacterium]
MWFSHHQKIHEPIALAAVISAAMALQVFWISNFLFSRFCGLGYSVVFTSGWEMIGVLYVLAGLVFLALWSILALVFRGRDVSHHRNSAFWFLVISLFIFLVMTAPPVFQLAI